VNCLVKGTRVRVLGHHTLRGRVGVVRRPGMCDAGAWVELTDGDLPENRTVWTGERRRQVYLYPEDCEPTYVPREAS
jgi:hypothetical protein